jgi:hypothetical protein
VSAWEKNEKSKKERVTEKEMGCWVRVPAALQPCADCIRVLSVSMGNNTLSTATPAYTHTHTRREREREREKDRERRRRSSVTWHPIMSEWDIIPAAPPPMKEERDAKRKGRGGGGGGRGEGEGAGGGEEREGEGERGESMILLRQTV